jgi:hypothetical protein
VIMLTVGQTAVEKVPARAGLGVAVLVEHVS